MASWPDSSVHDMYREMADLTLRIVCAALFRIESDERSQELVEAVHDFAGSLNVVLRRAFPLPGWVPSPGNRLRRTTVRRLDALAYDLIGQRRRSAGDDGDLLSMLATTAGTERLCPMWRCATS